MLRLAPVATIRQGMGFDDITDINNAIGFALDAVSASLIGDLRTGFERVSAVDVYVIDNPIYTAGQLILRLRASRGFLVGGSVVVRYADTVEKVQAGTDATTATDDFTVDLERGVLTCPHLDLADKAIRVSYTAGFEADGAIPTQYDMTQVPTWLQTLAALSTRIALDSHPSFKDAEATTDVSALKAQRSAIVQAKTRYLPSTLAPLFSV